MGGRESISAGRSDGQSSLGNFDKHESFGKAFNAAHSAGGQGHTFTYQGKLYNTNCKDGGDYRKEQDNRYAFTHRVSQYGHSMNASIKDTTGLHLQDRALGRGYKWTSDVDRQRAEYHRREAEKRK